MRRRAFLSVLGGAAVWPVSARAQQSRLIGVLMNGNSNEQPLQVNLQRFLDGLRDLGWIDGKNINIQIRWNGGSSERARQFASELAGLRPAAVMCASTTNLLALKNATNSIPIVFLQVSDPVAQGFISSLTKPGGNATGFSAYEFSIGGKWLEMLKQIAPKLDLVFVVHNPDTSPQTKYFLRSMDAVAPGLRMRVEDAPVRTMADIERVFERSAGGETGLIMPTDSFTRVRGDLIAALALRYRVPALSAFAEFIDAGGLMYYGSSDIDGQGEQYRQAAVYVDRILKGAKPADLPVQNATRYSLYINRKTATALGLEIPPRLLFTADKVIE